MRTDRAPLVAWSVLYHLVPRTLRGPRLLPLNDLQREHPDLFELHARKYRGREEVMRDRVPGLDCRWNDALFLTAVPPRMIRAAHEEAYLTMEEAKALQRHLYSLLQPGERRSGTKRYLLRIAVAPFPEE